MKKERKEKRLLQIIAIIFCVPIAVTVCGCKKQANPENKKMAVPASAAIIYTDINPDSAILKMVPAVFKLDLNRDGIIDFQFNAVKVLCGDGLIAPMVPKLYITVGPSSGGNTIMTNNVLISNPLNLAAAFDSAAVIAPGSLWVSASQISTPQVLLYGASSSGYIRCMVANGYWLHVSDKYLGLKFIKGNSTYYGWARLTSSYAATAPPYRHLTTGQLVLKGYAFNSIPNQPILAGQTR